MSVTVEISNTSNLTRVRSLLGAKSDEEAIEAALEKVIEVCEPVEQVVPEDLPDEYWDDLFSEPMLPDNAGSQALIDERNEARY